MSEPKTKEWEQELETAMAAADAARARQAPTEAAPSPMAEVVSLGDAARRRAEARMAQIPPTACDGGCGAMLRGERTCPDCEGKRLDRIRAAARYATIPEAFHGLTFGSALLRRNVRCAAAIKVGEGAVENARHVVLRGHTGAGKTSLAAAMMRRWTEQHARHALFAMGPRLAVARMDGETEEIRTALAAPLLMLDELPADAPPSGFTTISDILYQRHARSRPTWVTTWMGPAEVTERYGKGISRRIFEFATQIDCATGAVIEPRPTEDGT